MKRLKKSVKNGAFFHKTANDYNNLLQNKIITKDMSVNNFKKHCYRHLLQMQNEGPQTSHYVWKMGDDSVIYIIIYF